MKGTLEEARKILWFFAKLDPEYHRLSEVRVWMDNGEGRLIHDTAREWLDAQGECEWKEYEEGGWETKCGEICECDHVGTNGFKYCPYCGLRYVGITYPFTTCADACEEDCDGAEDEKVCS